MQLSRKVIIELRFRMAFHSQTVWKTGCMNGFFNQYLRNLVSADQRDWAHYVCREEYSCNVAMHLAPKVSSFVVAYGVRSNLHYKKPAYFVTSLIMSRLTWWHADLHTSNVLMRVTRCNARGHHKKRVDIRVTHTILGGWKLCPLGATSRTPKQ